MRFVLSRCCLLLAAVFCQQSAYAKSIRLATYNLNNYLVMDRHVGAVWRPSYPKPEADKTIIRQVIKQASPDILAVQEIGALPFLEELRADLALEGVALSIRHTFGRCRSSAACGGALKVSPDGGGQAQRSGL